jgi:hypothetical protein
VVVVCGALVAGFLVVPVVAVVATCAGDGWAGWLGVALDVAGLGLAVPDLVLASAEADCAAPAASCGGLDVHAATPIMVTTQSTTTAGQSLDMAAS